MAEHYKCCESEFFVQILMIILLVLFAGSMSGLTLGLMSMSLVDLEVLANSGTPKDRQHAGTSFFFSFCFKQLILGSAGKIPVEQRSYGC